MTENKLWPALIAARGKMPSISKTATNPHFHNRYAPLGEILSTVLPVLHSESLALSGAVREGALVVSVIHSGTGEVVESHVPLVGAPDMQKLGGAMTYAMRYGIGMLLALELDEDDDGNRASQRTAQTTPARTQPAGVGAPAPAPRQATTPKGRAKFQLCPLCGVSAVIKGKPEYGGGMLCWKKEGGCGNKFTDDLWAATKDDKPLRGVQAGYADSREADALIEGDEPPIPTDDDLPF